MSTQTNHDNEPFIVENSFKSAFEAAKKRYPFTREDFARRAVFRMCERIWSNDRKEEFEKKNFQELKSMVISELGVFGDDRSGYHSFLARYAKLGGFKSFHKGKSKQAKTEKAPPSPTPEADWKLIAHLCAKEQPAREDEAGEKQLSPDWEPPYEGPVWED